MVGRGVRPIRRRRTFGRTAGERRAWERPPYNRGRSKLLPNGEWAAGMGMLALQNGRRACGGG